MWGGLISMLRLNCTLNYGSESQKIELRSYVFICSSFRSMYVPYMTFTDNDLFDKKSSDPASYRLPDDGDSTGTSPTAP